MLKNQGRVGARNSGDRIMDAKLIFSMLSMHTFCLYTLHFCAGKRVVNCHYPLPSLKKCLLYEKHLGKWILSHKARNIRKICEMRHQKERWKEIKNGLQQYVKTMKIWSLSYIYDQFLLIWWEKALLTNVDHCPRVGVFLMVQLL